MSLNDTVIKIQQGTARGDVHLCSSCRSCVRRRGANGREDLQVCTTLGQFTAGRSGVICGTIAECSNYFPANLPTLYDLEQIAWEITTKGNRQIGFISPEDRRRAGIGPMYPAVSR